MAYVQTKTGTAASSTTLDVTFDSTTISGNAIIAFSASANGTAPTLTITDENSNTWSNDVSQTNGTDMKGQISSAPNITGGTTHWVRVTASAARDINLVITEVSGLVTSSILDKSSSNATNSGSGGTFTSNATTTTAQANEFLFGGLYINNNVAVTFDSPLTERSDFTSAFGDRMGHGTGDVASTGTYACSGTCSTFENYVALIATYKYDAPIDQSAFRFWNDDAAEASMTGAAAENTNLTATANTKKILRFEIEANGDPSSKTFKVKYQKNGSGGYSDLPISSGTSPTIGTPTIGSLAYSTSGGTSVAPGYPASIAANDTLVLIVGQKPSSANGGTCTTPANWTLVAQCTGATDGDTGGYTTTLGVDTGNTNIYVYTKDSVTGSESGTLSVTVGTNNVCWGAIIRIPKTADGTWSIIADTGKDTSAGNVSIASSGTMDVTANDMMIGAMVIPTDVTTPSQFTLEAMTQTSTTFGTMGELAEPDSTVGNDIGGFIFYQPVSSGGNTATVTMSATAGGTTTNVRGPGIILRARVTGITNDWYMDASSNIADAGSDTTTNRLTTSAKTFQAGWRIDNAYGSAPSFPAIDLTSDYHTELDVCINSRSGLAGGQYAEFRVYAGDTALTAYDYTPKWTIGAGGTTINATRVQLTLTERTASINAAKNIAANVDALALTEYPATVGLVKNISASVDALTLTEYPASLNIAKNIAANVDALTLTELPANVNAAKNIAAGTDSLTVTPYQATVSLGVGINATVANLSLTEYPANVNAAHNIAANVDALTLTPYQASVKLNHNISAGLASLTLTEFPAGINAAKNIQAGTDALTVTTYGATVTSSGVIFATVVNLALTTYPATVDYTGSVAETSRPTGGGRVIGYYPTIRLKKKPVVTVILPEEDNIELTRRLREIDAGYQKRRQEQLSDLLNTMRQALTWGQEVTLQGYDLLTKADIEATRRKVQQEEESILLLLQ